jgi:hypothetical protein
MHPVLEVFTILDVKLEGRHLANNGLRTKGLVCLFLMLTTMVVGFTLLPRANAVMVISAVNPGTGNVGSLVTLVANLTTTNGVYNVTFDGAVVAVGNAVGNQVNATFTVPETTLGNHTLNVVDLANTTETATGVFDVSTAYAVNVTLPQNRQLQEGDSVPILVNVTGGAVSTTYNTTITVQAPTNGTFSGQLSISTSALGSGVATLVYPDNFPSGANTTYVGNYVVSANSTVTTETFFVGLSNATQYHRMQAVGIKAVYAPNENVMLTVSGNGIQNSVNLTADSSGVIDYSNWTVPATASIGTYNVSIVSLSGQTKKDVLSVPDSQNFTVPGFAFNVTAKNLAGDTVSNVVVTAFENSVSVSNQTTSSNGTTVLMLEIGNYTLQGFSESVKVGETGFAVNDTEAFDFVLNLTNLNIKVVAVVNGVEIGIPEAGIFLTPENLTLTTDITGNVVANSLLPNDAYTLNVSRYNEPFNVTTIASLLVGQNPVPFFNVTISCPSYGLRVNASKADGQPFSNALVEVKELLGGIHYDGTTGPDGVVTFQNMALGRYDVEILDSTGMKLNSTTVDVFKDQNVTVNCSLFGLNISVTVTDYFGQPFGNTNVTLQGNGSEPISERTQSNGQVTFDNLVGDSFSISVYLSDQGSPTVVQSVVVDGSTVVPIRMNRYVLLAGLPVETSQLAISVTIILSVFLVVLLEVYRRRGKSKTVDS